MSNSSSNSQSQSTRSPISLGPMKKINDTGSMFISSDEHQKCADQVFKKDIDVIFNSKIVGHWKTSQYDVIRKYVPSSTPGASLYITILRPEQVIAAIVFVHGLGEHQGRYMQIADMFAREGYQVVLYDQRGNGRSGGIRGDTNVEFMHRDLDVVLQYVDRSVPTFCYAHALGAAIVISFCQINPHLSFQGIITTNAYLDLPEKYTRPKLILVNVLKKLLPNLMINIYPNYSLASKNNYHIKKLAEDHLLQPFMTISNAHEIIKLRDYIQPHADKFTTPILLIHGKLDRVSSHMESVEFYGKCKSTDRTLKIFEYGYHELHCDTEKDRLQKLVLNWCNKSLESDHKITNFSNLKHGLKQSKPIQKRKILLFFVLLFFLYQSKLKLKCMNLIGQIISQPLVSLLIKK